MKRTGRWPGTPKYQAFTAICKVGAKVTIQYRMIATDVEVKCREARSGGETGGAWKSQEEIILPTIQCGRVSALFLSGMARQSTTQFWRISSLRWDCWRWSGSAGRPRRKFRSGTHTKQLGY